jgi:predicted GTPase
MSTEIKRVTRSMTRTATQEPKVSTQSLYIYKDPKTGVEFLTKEQCDIRGITEEKINPPRALFYIKKIASLNDSYSRYLPDDIRLDRSLYALAPNGFVWEQGPSSTSYYSWDFEPYVLVPSPYI